MGRRSAFRSFRTRWAHRVEQKRCLRTATKGAAQSELPSGAMQADDGIAPLFSMAQY